MLIIEFPPLHNRIFIRQHKPQTPSLTYQPDYFDIWTHGRPDLFLYTPAARLLTLVTTLICCGLADMYEIPLI